MKELTKQEIIMPDEEKEPCQHEWKIVDESFNHEFGTEIIIFSECLLCGDTKPLDAAEYERDDFDIFDLV